ncbi:MAG TPA: SigE family RNA polymerase sigma factor [Actinocatenispora sp.]
MAELNGFGEFVAARSGTLMRLGYLLTGDHPHAEDLLQTALMHTAQRWRKITDPNAYAQRVMVNECTSWWRRRRIREHSTEHPPDRASGEDTANDVVRRDAFVRALRTLPPRQRAVIALRFYDDLSEAETARVLGCAFRGSRDPSGVLPSGEVVFGAPGPAPSGTPGHQRWRQGPGVYRMIDPRARRVIRTMRVDDAVTWGAQRQGGKLVWGDAGDSVSLLAVSPDGRSAALTGAVDAGPLIRIVDLGTGHVVHTIGLAHPVPVDDRTVVVSLWRVTRYEADRVTVVGYDGGPVVYLSIDPVAGTSVAGTTTRYPLGTVMPGARR